MDVKDMIRKFNCDHPVLTWILARLVICVCAFLALVFALLGLGVFIYPIVCLAKGYGFEAFTTWLWIPLIATVIWAVISATNIVLEEVIW